MTRPVNTPAFEWARRARGSSAERFLCAIGIDSDLIEAAVGDLTEEFANRAERDGARAARVWYAREAVRSMPYVILTALRHGGPRARLRLVACLATVLLPFVLTAAMVVLRDGPPVRLAASIADASEGLVVNTMRPIQLPIRAFDRRGHLLESRDVRYRWTSGSPIAISSDGVVACTQRGDAVVTASLGAITTNVDLRCRPVREMRASSWIDFMTGDPARDLPFVAIGVDDLPVMQLRGTARVLDSSVATLVGTTIRPRAIGQASVVVDVGDRTAMMSVIVHEQVASFVGLRPDQRFVAVPVRVAQGDTVHWALPQGAFWLKYLPRNAGEAPPTITVSGAISCSRGNGLNAFRALLDVYVVYCLVRAGGATVDVAHGRLGAQVVEGSLALQRLVVR
jgi:hypothetical protein